MKIRSVLLGATMLFACSAAQAAIFDFNVVYWSGFGNPPASPAARNTAHFQLDSTQGSRTPPGSHYQSTRFWAVGDFFGYSGEAMIDLYPTASFGGFDMDPWSDEKGPDYANGRSLGGDAIIGDDLDNLQIRTGTFYMFDWDWRPGMYQVTINELEEAGPVPEPISWAMMLIGFGAIGCTMRSRKTAVTFA